MTSSLLAYYYRIQFILKRGVMVYKSRAVICLKMQANSSSGSLHKTKSTRARLAESAWPVGRDTK